MLKQSMIAATAALAITTGATALQSTPAEAGVAIYLTHGTGHAWNRGYFHGPRYGYYRHYRPSCFTRIRKVKVRRWNHRKHRWVVTKIKRPVRVCR